MSDEQEVVPELQEFKGKQTVVLNPGAKFPFSFGLGKARLILQHIKTIEKFVESEGTSLD